jgi:hypothetical protein
MSTVVAYAIERRDTVSTPSRSTIINIVSWVLLALVISTLIARFAVKLSRRTNRRQLAQDDVLLVLAAVRRDKPRMMDLFADGDQFFSFGQTIAVSIQWKDTKSARHLESSNDDAISQKVYSANSGLTYRH